MDLQMWTQRSGMCLLNGRNLPVCTVSVAMMQDLLWRDDITKCEASTWPAKR